LPDKDGYVVINIVVLPGDGIGPEVIRAAVAVLDAVGERFGRNFQTQEYIIGGCAIDNYGVSLPENTLAACRTADAVLLGAVGGPKWDDPNAKVRPEDGLLGLRKELGLFANLRPVRATSVSMQISPIRPQRLHGVDLMVVRELTGGIYFGQPRGRKIIGGEVQAVDSMVYTESEVRRIADLAFDLAGQRRNKVTSVDERGGGALSACDSGAQSGRCCCNVPDLAPANVRCDPGSQLIRGHSHGRSLGFGWVDGTASISLSGRVAKHTRVSHGII